MGIYENRSFERTTAEQHIYITGLTVSSVRLLMRKISAIFTFKLVFSALEKSGIFIVGVIARRVYIEKCDSANSISCLTFGVV